MTFPTTWRRPCSSSNNCVELGWRTARCDNGSCVEVGQRRDGVLIRDTKYAARGEVSPVIVMGRGDWATTLAAITIGRTPDCVARVSGPKGDRWIWCGYTEAGEFVALRFDAAEWAAFRDGALAGEFRVPAPVG